MSVHHGHAVNGRPKAFLMEETAGDENPEIVIATITITALLAGTAVNIVPDARVLGAPNRRLLISDFDLKVNGATAWTTLTSLFIETTEASPTTLVTFAAAGLTANAYLGKHSANVTVANIIALRTGMPLGVGIQARANVNAGAGSDIVIVVYGKIVG